jgi:hypothetical protein
LGLAIICSGLSNAWKFTDYFVQTLELVLQIYSKGWKRGVKYSEKFPPARRESMKMKEQVATRVKAQAAEGLLSPAKHEGALPRARETS